MMMVEWLKLGIGSRHSCKYSTEVAQFVDEKFERLFLPQKSFCAPSPLSEGQANTLAWHLDCAPLSPTLTRSRRSKALVNGD